MSLSLVPTSQDAYFSLNINLEGTEYVLTFRYNQREACYYLSISTPNGVDLAVGIKCVATWPLLHKFAVDGLPPGELTIYANTSNTSPPDVGQLGEGLPFTMYYLSSNQLP